MFTSLSHLPSTWIMIDLETLALTPRAAVLQIGAVAWAFPEADDGDDGVSIEDTPIRSFNEYLNLGEQMDDGSRDVDAQTLKFHLDLGAVCLRESIDGNDVRKTLQEFTQFFAGFEFFAVLSRGSAFDFPILESLFADYDVTVPWKYNQVWDFRTVMNLMGNPGIPRPPHFINHDGFWDARFQMRQLVTILSEMGRAPEDPRPIKAAPKLNLNPQRTLRV